MSPKTREWAIPAGMALLAFLGSVTLYYTAKEDTSKADLQEEVNRKAYTKDVQLWNSGLSKEIVKGDNAVRNEFDIYTEGHDKTHAATIRALEALQRSNEALNKDVKDVLKMKK